MTQILKKTGERIVPEKIRTKEEYLQVLRHIYPYIYVKGEIPGDSAVLEVGFGEGYGTSLLSQTCRHIVGIDIDKKVVEYAQKKYGAERCEFRLYNGNNIPFPNNFFDVVISFQVIEHIVDDAGFISELHRVLKIDGRLYITTPNKTNRLKPGQKPWNRYHIREYYPHELEITLRGIFNDVDIWGISATEEIHRIEYNRFHQGILLNIALRLGFRQLIPKSIDPYIARFISRIKGRKTTTPDNKDFSDVYSLDDFRVEKTNVKESLDLLGVCCKT
jgi:ubiquinone/menaquinone biosynthesis C-methylase UbiE